MTNSWLLLLAAIALEVSGTTCMKVSSGMTRLMPTVLLFIFYGASLSCLTLALKTLEVSVAYAVWSGMGTALIVAIGLLWFREPVTWPRIVFILLIIVGAVGLNLSGAGP